MHFNVCLLFLLTFKIVLMTLALMKVYFSLLFAEWHIWMPKSVIECWLKCKNRYWIWFMRKCLHFRANECIVALLAAVSRKWLCIFSRCRQNRDRITDWIIGSDHGSDHWIRSSDRIIVPDQGSDHAKKKTQEKIHKKIIILI